MFNKLRKLTKILKRDNSMQQVLFHFSRSAAVLRILVSIKNLGQYKKLPLDKLVKKKKRTFCKTLRSTRNFFKLQCLADDLVDFLELSMFINVSLP